VEFYVQKDSPGKNVANGRVLSFKKTAITNEPEEKKGDI
jgi:hypothetical protein